MTSRVDDISYTMGTGMADKQQENNQVGKKNLEIKFEWGFWTDNALSGELSIRRSIYLERELFCLPLASKAWVISE